MLDTPTLDRLLARGKQAGRLTTADLAEALPVDAMDAEEIALVVAYLEERGVAVELDDDLAAARTTSTSPSAAAPELVLPAEERSAPPVQPSMLSTGGPSPAPSAPQRPHDATRLHAAVIAAILILVIFALAILATR